MRVIFLLTFILLTITNCDAQVSDPGSKNNKWFITLPLRFTQLQNTNTMLSGIKAGKGVHKRLDVSLTVYHSFYFQSFHSKANLPGFNEQPRLFINCVGAEVDFKLYEFNRFSIGVQALIGWGFMKYDLDRDDFESSQVNYVAIEPAIVSHYRHGGLIIGIGISYRPIIGQDYFQYSSSHGHGTTPVNRDFPNGFIALLTVTGLLTD